MKANKENFNKVLDNIKQSFNHDDNDKDVWLEVFNDMLDDLRDDDFFGTEGQCDPRGDGRND